MFATGEFEKGLGLFCSCTSTSRSDGLIDPVACYWIEGRASECRMAW
jgi:hypothetical protein